jgi:hypothetical protein
VVVLGRERRVDFVFVVDFVVLVQKGIRVHHFVRGIESEFVDEHHRKDVLDVLARGRPMGVVSTKEITLVRMEYLLLDVDFGSEQNRHQNQKIEPAEFEGSEGQFPKIGSNLWTRVEPWPSHMLLDFVLFEKRIPTGIDRYHHECTDACDKE